MASTGVLNKKSLPMTTSHETEGNPQSRSKLQPQQSPPTLAVAGEGVAMQNTIDTTRAVLAKQLRDEILADSQRHYARICDPSKQCLACSKPLVISNAAFVCRNCQMIAFCSKSCQNQSLWSADREDRHSMRECQQLRMAREVLLERAKHKPDLSGTWGFPSINRPAAGSGSRGHGCVLPADWPTYWRCRNASEKSPSRLAFYSEKLSYPLTVMYAAARMVPKLALHRSLRIHVLGTAQNMSMEFMQQIRWTEVQYQMSSIHDIELTFVSEDVPDSFHGQNVTLHLPEAPQQFSCTITYIRRKYDAFVDEPQWKRPDLVLAFNSGIHSSMGSGEWARIMKYLLDNEIPCCFSAYTEHEAHWDERTLRDLFGAAIYLRASRNPFRSMSPIQMIGCPSQVYASNYYVVMFQGYSSRPPKASIMKVNAPTTIPNKKQESAKREHPLPRVGSQAGRTAGERSAESKRQKLGGGRNHDHSSPAKAASSSTGIAAHTETHSSEGT